MSKRRYRLKERAARQRETRERIVDAAVALHEDIGPAATTISALAERAGVQRLTVYRHFANEEEILKACSAKWLSLHPPPDIPNLTREDREKSTLAALLGLYTYYEGTQDMWRSLYRDAGQLPALDEPMRQFDGYLAAVAKAVLAAWAPSRSKRLRATVGHALRFSTWQSLHAQGLAGKAMAALVGEWIQAAASVR
jgi:AcrR family transcriptional regulator